MDGRGGEGRRDKSPMIPYGHTTTRDGWVGIIHPRPPFLRIVPTRAQTPPSSPLKHYTTHNTTGGADPEPVGGRHPRQLLASALAPVFGRERGANGWVGVLGCYDGVSRFVYRWLALKIRMMGPCRVSSLLVSWRRVNNRISSSLTHESRRGAWRGAGRPQGGGGGRDGPGPGGGRRQTAAGDA